MELFVLDVVTIIMMVLLLVQLAYIFALRNKMERQIERMKKMEAMIAEISIKMFAGETDKN